MEALGTKLSEARIKLNLSLEQVSEKTKIRPYILQAIEEGDTSKIQPVYMRSFIKTYAKFLKIPEDEISDSFNEYDKSSRKSQIRKRKATKATDEDKDLARIEYSDIFKKKSVGKKTYPNFMIYIFYSTLGIAAFALLYFALFTNGNGNNVETVSDMADSAPDTTIIESKDESLLSYFDKPDSLVLEAKSIDTAWLKIDIDGKFNDQLLMYPSIEKRWAAKEFFVLSLGNIGAIEFKRNGQLLQPFGPKGSVIRNLKITADKIESSSSPWQDQRTKKVKTKKKKSPPPLIEPSKPIENIKIKKDTDSNL
jgi:transcriptional regulator with XRE-family HTH domain